MNSPVLRVGTRSSALALRQADLAVEHLSRVRPGLVVDIVGISTKGDRDKSTPFAELGTKAIFAHELQRALLDDEIDVAVHSLKDLTGAEPEGLVIASVPERADPRDVLVSREGGTLGELAAGSVVGTSSVRREALIRAARPDLRTAPLRGNVDTRLRKVADGEVDAAILAAAGIVRLQREGEITEWLDPSDFVPPPGQGAIAIEARAERVAGDLAWIVESQDDVARRCVDTERAFMEIVEGSCEVPLGAWARPSDHEPSVIVFDAFVVGTSGEIARTRVRGSDPATVGAEAAHMLL
jgi:hydroxymethylbilane synthase